MTVLEAMAQGSIVVASDVGGHRELVRDGETGLLHVAGDATSLADRLYTLLHDPQLGAALRQAGRRFVEQERNWATSVANYQAAYERLLGA